VYWLYYAVSSFGSNHSAIGLATSKTAAAGSWTDHGLVYSSQQGGDYNAIDPGLTVDAAGHWWLSFGSFWTGIKMIQIDPATGKQLASNTTRYSIARRTNSSAIEGAYVHPHGGYYYLFTSFDYCCRGSNSTYRIMVARATSPTPGAPTAGPRSRPEPEHHIVRTSRGRVPPLTRLPISP
jgi:arabinan endo-1,5-alpha-L-arabinosidase